eukprot:sb/3464161/
MLLSLGLVSVLTLVFLFWFYFIRNTSGVPITPGWKYLTGHMHHFMGITKETLHKYEEMYFDITDPAKHGPVTHMKFFNVSNMSLNTAQTAEPLLKCNVNVNKSFQYDEFTDFLKGSVLILPGTEWYTRRKMLTPAFHFTILDDFVTTIRRHAEFLISDLEAKPVDHLVCDTMQEITFLSLCETSFNTTFESRAAYEPFFSAMNMINMALLNKGLSYSGQIWWIWEKTAAGKDYKEGMAKLREFVLGLVAERRKALDEGRTELHNGKRGFLDLMVLEQKEKGELTEDQMVGECNTILLAGQGTTTGTISFCLAYLCEFDEWQEKLHTEIMDQLAGRDISELDPSNLPLMNMVIKETLRLQPPASLVGRKLSQPLTTGGYTLPAGTNVDIGIYHIHRDPENWEGDVERFDPYRFTPEKMKARNPYSWIPFSAGPRNCVGQRFAQMELRILLSYMIYNFKFSSTQRMGKELVRYINDLTPTPGPDFRVTFTKRE